MAPTRKAHLPRRDDLPTIKSAALRKAGVITAAMTSAVIELAGVKREVALSLKHWPHGGSWSFFTCPTCSRRCNTLRLYDGRFVCVRCDGLLAHSQMHN
jgi:anaerobic selenocysteine-containing dehydrogenase